MVEKFEELPGTVKLDCGVESLDPSGLANHERMISFSL